MIIRGECDREGTWEISGAVFNIEKGSGRGFVLGSAVFKAVEVHEQTDGRLVLGACMKSSRLEHA